MSSDNIQKQLDQIRISYIESLVDKKDSIQEIWQELELNWQHDEYEKLFIIVHSLAGSAGTFDLPDITNKARAVIDYFKANKPDNKMPKADFFHQADGLITQLKKVMKTAK